MKASGRKVFDRTRVLELNAKHPLIQNLAKRAEATPEDGDPDFSEWIELLYEQTRLAEGSAVEDPNLPAMRRPHKNPFWFNQKKTVIHRPSMLHTFGTTFGHQHQSVMPT